MVTSMTSFSIEFIYKKLKKEPSFVQHESNYGCKYSRLHDTANFNASWKTVNFLKLKESRSFKEP